MLTRLIYASTPTAAMDYPTVVSIDALSARRNAAIGVTGLLVHGTTGFLQVLEGDRKAINDTYRRITADARHNAQMILQVCEISRRHFQEWAMKLVLLDGVKFPRTAAILQRFGTTENFDPYGYSGESALQLLCALSQQPGAD